VSVFQRWPWVAYPSGATSFDAILDRPRNRLCSWPSPLPGLRS
jgi:hypothetical protein